MNEVALPLHLPEQQCSNQYEGHAMRRLKAAWREQCGWDSAL